MSTPSLANDRARMPEGTSHLLDQRTLAASYRSLAALITPGMAVLDVGCGTGAITRGMAELTTRTGTVLGIDASPALIAEAQAKHAGVAGLGFAVADVHTFRPDVPFDVVASARTLQWLANPYEALQRMVGFLKPGGIVSVLDYNHEKIAWNPAPPASMLLFYDAFLRWRADAGMQNDIADRLAGYFETAGLGEIATTSQAETVRRTDPGYAAKMGIWAIVAETRGHQLVADGYVTEAQRQAAVQDYTAWVATDADRMEMYLLAVEGRSGLAG
ncbi:MAG: methyltransferase domain-containing protein [Cytophagales bacterium]|nr:methyltransferase domain-containing protein [Cytophagales bacterium]